ncbi:hypothetical protein DFS33DRAFT_1352993 [Desarmillaria ectypa]|nr:hypothetical protein DFS33DRAFT_1352993 [Desarmillaria ectypa]
MLASIFGTYSAPHQEHKLGKRRLVFNVQTFLNDWLRSNRVTYMEHILDPKFHAYWFLSSSFRSWVDIHSIGPSLPTELRMTFTYSPPTTDQEVEIRTMFVDHTLRGGPPLDRDTRRRLLEAESWVHTNSMGYRCVWCMGCKERIDFIRDDFDVREWQEHRDFCFGISDRMKKAVVKEIFWNNCQRELTQCAEPTEPVLEI